MVDCTFIIFGITGDLSKRKLLPGLCKLIRDQKINNFCLVGVGLEKMTIDEIFEQIQTFIQDVDRSIVAKIKEHFSYVQSDIHKDADFTTLNKVIIELEARYDLCGNRLAYCATPSFLFAEITKKLCEQGILTRKKADDPIWHRIAYEKPFGYDLKSAKKINKQILALLYEFQIFRIDHYLAKEVVENILYIRFTNHIFESLWNNKHIESVQIILSESIGVENRGAYYEKFGALSDIVQNHILQLLALITMNAPKKLIGDEIRTRKVNILKNVKIEEGFFGQYEGYLQEAGVHEHSTTDTFVYLKMFVHDKRWKNVPFYIKTGKCLPSKETKIHIQFKPTECTLTKEHCPMENNYLTIDLYPKGGFSFEVNAKKPGVRNEIVPVVMDFCYECLFVPSTPEAYENLLFDIMHGDQAVSVRFDEIELSWKIIDAIRSMKLPLYTYKRGSQGPAALDDVAKKNNVMWR